MSKTIVALLISAFFSFGLDTAVAHAQQSSAPRLAPSENHGIAVLSDLHLRYHEPDRPVPTNSLEAFAQTDIHSAAVEAALKHIESQSAIRDLIINGDVFHGPSTTLLSDDKKIEVIAEFLLYLRTRLGRTIHFNFGNHDEKWDVSTNPRQLETGFSERLATRIKQLAPHGIFLIGDQSRNVFAYQINGLKFLISHSPFVKTPQLLHEVYRIPRVTKADGTTTEHPAVKKIMSQRDLTSDEQTDGVIRIFSDNHTALADRTNRIYDTGKLTEDLTLPNEPKTFLILDSKGTGTLLEVDPQSKVHPLLMPPGRCQALFRDAAS